VVKVLVLHWEMVGVVKQREVVGKQLWAKAPGLEVVGKE
jgi:hypothetical protein